MEIIGYLVNEEIIDTQSAKQLGINGEPIVFDNSPYSLEIIRHSSAHLMAQAIKELYPEAKFFVGPVVDEGFYYDLKTTNPIGEEELKTIEKKMKELAKKKIEITKYTTTKTKAQDKYKVDNLKTWVLNNIQSDEVSFYVQGDFEDLCRGPHVPNTGFLYNVKLTKVAGAYLGGDEKNEMLTRIYGISFATKEALDEHLLMIEEAKKRDHRKLGTELELFTFREEIGGGLPVWLPKGARLRGKLERILYKAHRVRGYEPVRGPEILKSDMWMTSGHYQNYGENMYLTKIEEQEYGIKPMNCLGHIKVFESDLRSYKQLPLKFFEYGVVHRHEKSGVLHGLLRVREFTQDDAHIFCTKEQIKEVIFDVLEFVHSVMNIFGFNYTMELATKPTKAIGEDTIWEIATESIRAALDENGKPYGIDEGGGAFYGPKIDIKITDALGRKWQCGTMQVDFNLPQRFDIGYKNANNEREQPVMIHRAILGSFERFIAILTEHYAGEFPMFIAPTAVIFIPIRDEHVAYAKELAKKLLSYEIDSEIYDENESLNKRIRNAEKQRVPMIVIIGDAEVEGRKLAIRDRREKQQYELNEGEFLRKLVELTTGINL